MAIKENNHVFPRFHIRRWIENDGKIFIKEKNSSRRIDLDTDYAKKFYYSLGKEDDTLENRIAKFETYAGILLAKINKANGYLKMPVKDMEILKLYAALQACRNENTSSVINNDDSGIYKNNNYLFGVPLLTTQEQAVDFTSTICNEFERLKDVDKQSEYSFDYRFFVPGGLNSQLVWGLHLVIVTNHTNAFLVSETTAIIECSMDNDYMFTYVPVSPKIGLVLAKSKYFFSKNEIEATKIRFGYKYGKGTPDPRLSEVIDDSKLIFQGIKKENYVKINFVELDANEIYNLNSIIYEDGSKILYSNEDALNQAKSKNDKRKVSCSMFVPF